MSLLEEGGYRFGRFSTGAGSASGASGGANVLITMDPYSWWRQAVSDFSGSINVDMHNAGAADADTPRFEHNPNGNLDTYSFDWEFVNA